MMDRIENIHNRASDTNWVWFPFQFLRPLPQQEISLLRRALMAILFGLYFGVFYFIKKLAGNEAVDFESSLKTTTYSIFIFFIWFNLVTAFFWNRRAHRLQGAMKNEHKN